MYFLQFSLFVFLLNLGEIFLTVFQHFHFIFRLYSQISDFREHFILWCFSLCEVMFYLFLFVGCNIFSNFSEESHYIYFVISFFPLRFLFVSMFSLIVEVFKMPGAFCLSVHIYDESIKTVQKNSMNRQSLLMGEWASTGEWCLSYFSGGTSSVRSSTSLLLICQHTQKEIHSSLACRVHVWLPTSQESDGERDLRVRWGRRLISPSCIVCCPEYRILAVQPLLSSLGVEQGQVIEQGSHCFCADS